MKKTFGITIQAHRGFSAKYPENTLLAFEKAIEAKADYIELDVRASSDNQIFTEALTPKAVSRVLAEPILLPTRSGAPVGRHRYGGHFHWQ